jgi:tetratricopeptide (TPR) repeat protein
MSELRLENWSMPAADLGVENPVPPLVTGRDLHTVQEADPAIPADMKRNIAYGHLPGILPYTMQDGYTRERRLRDFRVAVLENEHLKATFLLELGGRLWSLIHKPTGRELLAVNPVFQPANLALRNAWFSGGVEWNIGTIGHSPFTCAPLFAARAEAPDGTPILRMFEWERIRQVPFQIDVTLPDGSPVLFVHVRISNPHDYVVPMYWWSNIAVPETADTRVIVPAESAYRFNYSKLDIIPVTAADQTDITYAANLNQSADFFYHILDERRHWITALDGNGKGLVQVSSDRLQGRKLFVWGMGSGGRRWQHFLSPTGQPYIEIQAGLARTQLEHLPMPPGEWTWIEAYGLLEADPSIVHDGEWAKSQHAVETALEQLIPSAVLEAAFEKSTASIDSPPTEILERGSGWGALERLRRQAVGEKPFCSEALVFDDDSLQTQQEPWLHLLSKGVFPAPPPENASCVTMVQRHWRKRLENSVTDTTGDNWAAWLNLGVMRHYAGDRDGACRAWERSLEHEETAWAARNLAILAMEDEDKSRAIKLFDIAYRNQPDLLPLIVEYGRALIAAGQPQNWLALAAELPEPAYNIGRVRLLEAQAALAVGDFKTVDQFFDDQIIIADIREGETSLSDLWYGLHIQRISKSENISVDNALRTHVQRKFPVPKLFDYRMVGNSAPPIPHTEN